MDMKGKKQLDRSRSIAAPVGLVYRLFMDNAELHRWAPPVNRVLSETAGDASGVGTTRTCDVTMQGRNGTMVEQCLEAVEETRASFLVVDDSFGFRRMFRDYGFTVHFAGGGDGTTVRMETFYTPANPLFAAMNALVARRKFAAVVDGLIAGLGALAEERWLATRP